MKASEYCIGLIKDAEGYVPKAYQDAVGVWTICYGSTRDVKPGDTATPAECHIRLVRDIEDAENDVRRMVKVPLTQGQFDALVSFVFNVGGTKFKRSTLLRKLNARDYAGAADQFRRWVYAGGERLQGLVLRREAERRLFVEGTPNGPYGTR